MVNSVLSNFKSSLGILITTQIFFIAFLSILKSFFDEIELNYIDNWTIILYTLTIFALLIVMGFFIIFEHKLVLRKKHFNFYNKIVGLNFISIALLILSAEETLRLVQYPTFLKIFEILLIISLFAASSIPFLLMTFVTIEIILAIRDTKKFGK